MATPDESASADQSATAGASKAELDRAFSELYRTHLRDVYSYAYYKVGNHHDAEDLTEQAFLQAYRHFERARRESNGRPFRPGRVRLPPHPPPHHPPHPPRRPEANLDAVEPPSHPHGTERVVEGREELREVIAHVQELPDDRREALIMRFAPGLVN